MVDKKEESKRVFDPKNSVMMNWDNHGNCFVSMPVNNIPKKQFEEWINECRVNYSGKRWDMIMADHIEAKAYRTMLAVSSPPEAEIPEEVNTNPDGLLNPDVKVDEVDKNGK